MKQQRIHRPSARVVVVDEDWRVLLIEVLDPSSNAHHWIVPGGGIEVGETLAQAAARELTEETGLVLTPEELGRPIAQNNGNWEFRGQWYYSEIVYFFTQVPAFELSLEGLTTVEVSIHIGWRWWTLDDLDRSTDRVIPLGLAEAVRSVRDNGLPPEALRLPFE